MYKAHQDAPLMRPERSVRQLNCVAGELPSYAPEIVRTSAYNHTMATAITTPKRSKMALFVLTA